jgi:bifunctional non-homologous end joining protein LigD
VVASPDARLGRYRSKRDFSRTAEPAGGATTSHDGQPRFVVQRHRARRLHYDVRFEVDGVLVSFAVPKGPSLDPSVKRLAVHVEDHPIEYLDFEGVIPGGEYGGGDVIVWDIGTWELHGADDARSAIDAGELHAEMHGEKLTGRLVLVRRGRADGRGGREDWLLFHKRDDAAMAGWDPEDHPHSVISGRTNGEVAADPDALWRSDRPASVAREILRPVGATPDELAQLDELGDHGTWSVDGQELRLTNLDAEMFPGRGREGPLIARDLVRYHATVAPLLLPHLAGRPLEVQRFPHGVDHAGTWQRSIPSRAPSWLQRWEAPRSSQRSSAMLVADSTAALVWLANQRAVELRPWTSRIDEPRRPTEVCFDIAPDADRTWDDVLTLARLHCAALDHLGVRGHPMLDGLGGIQVIVPIEPRRELDEAAAWVDGVSRSIEAVVPELAHDRADAHRSPGESHVTLAAPYGVRAAAGAPVSTPITWEELDDPDLRPDGWTMRTILGRVLEVGDLMAGAMRIAQGLPDLGVDPSSEP